MKKVQPRGTSRKHLAVYSIIGAIADEQGNENRVESFESVHGNVTFQIAPWRVGRDSNLHPVHAPPAFTAEDIPHLIRALRRAARGGGAR